MRNIIYLVIAALFFGLAFFAYWLATDSSPEIGTRNIGPRALAPPSELMLVVQQWQPVLSLVSSVGGIVSLLFQLRIWMRSRG